MSIKSAGLTVQEAWAEAEAELSEATDNSLSIAVDELKVQPPSDEEQSAVETEAKGGLFNSLASESGVEQSEEELHEVKVNGVVSRVTLQELVNGYQRQADYTQGKQEIAETKEKYANAITLWEALEADYVKTVQALMARSGIRGQVKPVAASDVDVESLVEQKLQEKLAQDPRIQAIERDQQFRQIESIFAQIEKDFNIELEDSDKLTVLQKADDMGTTDLKYVTWMLLQEVERKTAEQKNIELVSTANGRRSGIVDEPEVQPVRFNSPMEAWKAVVAEEDNLR